MAKKRFFNMLLCIGAAAMCLTGCGGNADDNGTDLTVKDGGVMTENESEDNDMNVGKSHPTEDGTDEIDTSVGGDDSLGADDGSGAFEADGAGTPDIAENTAKDRWKGAGVSILGDSISTFDGWIPGECVVFYPLYGEVTDVSDTWWHQVIEEAELELCTNNSSAGCTCAGDSLSIDDPAYACSGGRISMLMGKGGRMPELILVYLGTNDLLKGIPLGDNDGTRLVEEGEIDNFSDAYSLILDKLASEYPTAQVYCCTLAQVGDWGTEQPFVTFENHLGLTAADYSETIRTVAAGKGVPVIDLYNCGIEIDNLQQMSSDGVHLTPTGMEFVKKAVLKAIWSDIP